MKNQFITTIQCRMNSKRLPGKVIKKFGSFLSIEILINRIKKSKYVGPIILLTTKNKQDDILVKIAKKNKINFFRGKEDDVLDRFAKALIKRNEKYVIQLTGDNPFVDPEIIDIMCKKIIFSKVDFFTNNGFMKFAQNHFPLGMHISIFKRKKLIEISKKTKDLEDREHPTLYFYRNKKKIYKLKNFNILKKWKKNFLPRLTLDTEEDYKFLKKIFNFFNKYETNIHFDLQMIMNYLNNNKNLININKKIKHKIPTKL